MPPHRGIITVREWKKKKKVYLKRNVCIQYAGFFCVKCVKNIYLQRNIKTSTTNIFLPRWMQNVSICIHFLSHTIKWTTTKQKLQHY